MNIKTDKSSSLFSSYVNTIFIIACLSTFFAYPLQAEPTRQLRIIGGENVQMSLYPWMVSIYFEADSGNNMGHLCGGSLISPTWILTAAHCIKETVKGEKGEKGEKGYERDYQNKIEKISVRFTTYDNKVFSDKSSKAIKKVVVHPDWIPNWKKNENNDNDIALLELEEPITTVKPLALNSSTNKNNLPNNAMVIGWGAIENEKILAPEVNVLKQVRLPLVSNEICHAAGGINITNKHICAGIFIGGKDSCKGDSGGPLFVQYGNKWVQIGIVSTGTSDTCANQGHYGVYTRLSEYNNFIKQHVTEGLASLPVGEAHASANGKHIYLPQVQWQTDPVQFIWVKLQQKENIASQYTVEDYGFIASGNNQASAELDENLQLTISRLVLDAENHPRYNATLQAISSDDKATFQLETVNILEE